MRQRNPNQFCGACSSARVSIKPRHKKSPYCWPVCSIPSKNPNVKRHLYATRGSPSATFPKENEGAFFFDLPASSNAEAVLGGFQFGRWGIFFRPVKSTARCYAKIAAKKPIPKHCSLDSRSSPGSTSQCPIPLNIPRNVG